MKNDKVKSGSENLSSVPNISGNLRTIVEAGDSAIGFVIEAAVTSLTEAIVTANGAQTLVITEVIEEKTATILAAIRDVPDRVSQKFQEEAPTITEQVSDQVALKMVGERYYKWNSTSSFYPTVVFIFREINAANQPKNSS